MHSVTCAQGPNHPVLHSSIPVPKRLVTVFNDVQPLQTKRSIWEQKKIWWRFHSFPSCPSPQPFTFKAGMPCTTKVAAIPYCLPADVRASLITLSNPQVLLQTSSTGGMPRPLHTWNRSLVDSGDSTESKNITDAADAALVRVAGRRLET